jgi:hypothetical protein
MNFTLGNIVILISLLFAGAGFLLNREGWEGFIGLAAIIWLFS